MNKDKFLVKDGNRAEWGVPEGYPYKEIGTILDGTFEFIDNRGIYMYQITDENFTIVDGKSYTVIWDGTTYHCIATTFSGGLVLGNLGILGAGSADTGEPFLFGIIGTNKFIYTTDTAATHTITVRMEIVYPITSEFLPDGVKNRMSLIVINAQMPSSAQWNSVTYGNGKFVAIARGSIQTAYSKDGITWKNTFEYLSQNNSDITESVRSIINNETIIGVPACTTADNGKVLKVVNGVPTWVEA